MPSGLPPLDLVVKPQKSLYFDQIYSSNQFSTFHVKRSTYVRIAIARAGWLCSLFTCTRKAQDG